MITEEITEDGSKTLFVPELNEHYHSFKGAMAESRHVYINTGFNAVVKDHVRVLEMGFGTGLNALLTLEAAEQQQRSVHYTGVELYPLEWQSIKPLNYTQNNLSSYSELFHQIHTSAWETENMITPDFILRKICLDFLQLSDHERYDIIYYDAFAPEKQPELWTQSIFDKLYHLTNESGVLTTYCAKGEVRRSLQRAGFTVERLAGPVGGKREILRARKE